MDPFATFSWRLIRPPMTLLVYGRRWRHPYDQAMSTYVGVASLVDGESGTFDVRVTLARADADGSHWFGSVQGMEEHLELDGHQVTVQLPTGARGHANVVIDLTEDVPHVRLVGSGPSPI